MKGTLGLRIPSSPSPPLTATSNPSNNIIGLPSTFLPFKSLNKLPSFHLKSYKSTRYDLARFLVFAADNGKGGSNGENAEDLFSNNEKKQKQSSNGKEKGLNGNDNGINSNNGDKKENGNGRPRLNFKWIDLLIDPDPDNVVAVGLTGVLAWASVQVLWQLFVISVAIILAALKYSFIAALLIFILITLL